MLHESPAASVQPEQLSVPSANVDRHLGNLYPEAIIWKKIHGEIVEHMTSALLDIELMDTSIPLQLRKDLAQAVPSILFAAKHHDIGLLHMGSDVTQDEVNGIVNKDKDHPLTDAEWEIMKRHPLQGALLLEEKGIDNPLILAMVAMHHKFQDKQYPSNDDPEFKRILSIVPANKVNVVIHGASLIALADTVHAIRGERPYDGCRSDAAVFAEVCSKSNGLWSNKQVSEANKVCNQLLSQEQPATA